MLNYELFFGRSGDLLGLEGGLWPQPLETLRDVIWGSGSLNFVLFVNLFLLSLNIG